jgi:septal ring factor EnvC (AmiA/AmiB activator)
MKAAQIVLALLGVSGAAQAQVLQRERTQVRAHLAAERAALALTQNQQANVAEVMVWVGTLAHASSQRATALLQETKALDKRLDHAEQNEALAREAMTEQLGKLGPRLTSLYRMTRRSRLDVLLSAPDLAQMFWRAWALKKLLRADLLVVEETQRVAR